MPTGFAASWQGYRSSAGWVRTRPMLESATASPSTLHAYNHVWSIYMPIAVGVFALVMAILLTLLIAGARRRRAGRRSEAMRVESVYAAVLALVVAFLLYVTFSAETPIDHPVAHPALHVEVVAAQWSWRFEYPNGVTVTTVSTWHPKPAYVPAGVEVQFTGTSRDVIHGFWVPRLHFQRQLLPGYRTRFDMLFGAKGSYLGVCSVYCGQRHSQMHFEIRAVSWTSFEHWLAKEAQAQKAHRPNPGIRNSAVRAGRTS